MRWLCKFCGEKFNGNTKYEPSISHKHYISECKMLPPCFPRGSSASSRAVSVSAVAPVAAEVVAAPGLASIDLVPMAEEYDGKQDDDDDEMEVDMGELLGDAVELMELAGDNHMAEAVANQMEIDDGDEAKQAPQQEPLVRPGESSRPAGAQHRVPPSGPLPHVDLRSRVPEVKIPARVTNPSIYLMVLHLWMDESFNAPSRRRIFDVIHCEFTFLLSNLVGDLCSRISMIFTSIGSGLHNVEFQVHSYHCLMKKTNTICPLFLCCFFSPYQLSKIDFVLFSLFSA